VVTELRVAPTTRSWFHHKVVRTVGYLREIFRFAPAMPAMNGPMRAILLWRAFALTLVPLAGLAATVAIGVWLGPAVVAGAAAVALGLATLSRRRGGVPAAILVATLPFWLLLVTLTALVLYPFFRPGAAWARPMLRIGESEVGS
jgi:hypothetical protein